MSHCPTPSLPPDSPLFELPARATDPETSRAAARSRSHRRSAQTQRTQLLAAVRRKPGLTAVELAQTTGVDRHAASRRLPELESAGEIRKGEPRHCTVNGSLMLTWWPTGTGDGGGSGTTGGEQAPRTVELRAAEQPRRRGGERDKQIEEMGYAICNGSGHVIPEGGIAYFAQGTPERVGGMRTPRRRSRRRHNPEVWDCAYTTDGRAV